MAVLHDIVDTLRTIIDVEQNVRSNYRDMATTVYDRAASRYRPMSHSDVDTIAQGKPVDWTEKGPHLFLPQITHGKATIPVSGLCLNLRDPDKPELRFHVAFFAASDLVEPPSDASELHGIGFRFETPEGSGVGKHGFYHAQPFTHFVKNVEETRLANCPEWIPVKQPAFPLNAHDPLGLVAILLVSMYGPGHVRAEYGPELLNRIPTSATVVQPTPKKKRARTRKQTRGRGRRDR
jgi:hypothetical protein